MKPNHRLTESLNKKKPRSAAKSARIEATEAKDLYPNASVELLINLGVSAPDGSIHRDGRRKLKQIFHLVELMKQEIEPAILTHPKPWVVDLGAGKSTLGFLLYEHWLKNIPDSRLTLVEARKDLCASVAQIASKSGFLRTEVVCSKIADAQSTVHQENSSPFAVCALHACDTATDEAIAFALAKEAQHLFLIPCCQAELAQALPKMPDDAVSLLWGTPLHKREFGSLLTNVMRTLVLQSRGYRVRVTEFVGLEHSLKNELISAKKMPPSREGEQIQRQAKEHLLALKNQFGVMPKNLEPLI